MATTRDVVAAAVALAVLGVGGCTDTQAAARDASSANLKSEVSDVLAQTKDLARKSVSGAAARASLRDGTIAAELPPAVRSISEVPQPTLIGQWDANADHATFSYKVVATALGEHGGGDLSNQVSTYTCLTIRAKVGGEGHIDAADTTCREDLGRLFRQNHFLRVPLAKLTGD